MAQEAAAYYSALMSPKPSQPEAARKCTAKLAESPLSATSRKKLEGPIKLEEVQRAINMLAPGKSGGPDGIPAEYFRAMQCEIAQDLTDDYNAIFDDRQLTANMSLGEIILLYKKGDPRDIKTTPPNHAPQRGIQSANKGAGVPSETGDRGDHQPDADRLRPRPAHTMEHPPSEPD
jgi:hypothetical protein